MKISVVMALYNTPYDYLKATVESLLNQTFKDFELVIVDDASTMEYDDFFKQFNDEKIKYNKLEKNAGPGHARNYGIKQAHGDYVAIADSDDIYMPQRLEFQAKFLDENPDISLIGAAYKYSNRKKLEQVLVDDRDIRIFTLFNSPLNNSTVMFRRQEFLDKNLFYSEDIKFGEDYELWIKAMLSGVKMSNFPEFLMIYTRRPGQLSRARTERQIKILKNIYKKLFDQIGIEANEEEFDLHHDIYTERFTTVKSAQQISNWFDKIIEANKNKKMFEEPLLIEKKNQTLEKYDQISKRLFKIKIGQKNFCLSKSLKIYVEDRN